ncbi:MAG: CHAP domain-containing protein [Azospirillum sp.]|nr:CHAP domain-containing protein [Azospirillum sp.]
MRRSALRFGIALFALVLFSITSSVSAQAQMCVRYARALTHFDIHGDAWTWWQGAVGRYQRSARPAVGAVLVFKRNRQLHVGHVSVVSGVVDRRTIRVDHSWLGGQGLRRGMLVVDASPHNDWSSVRVWHEPTAGLGTGVYPTYGFIQPHGLDAPREERIEMASLSLDSDLDEGLPAPAPYRKALSRRHHHASAVVAPRKPGHRQMQAAASVHGGRGHTGHDRVALAVVPNRKPGARDLAMAPRRKPGPHIPQVAESVVSSRDGTSQSSDE